ncbi:TPA: phosphoribosyltransferase family protein, partial [Streptococcus suis]|nr:adenine phosphoribosyltransferase [Enterococcus faecium]
MESTDVINEIRGILPRNSIGKYDLLTIFTHKTVFDKIVKVLSLDFQNKVDYVAAPEAIGWILGTAIAKELGVGFIGVRKGDKLPYAKEEIISTHFTDYSGQDKSFEISKSSIVRNKRVLIVDDWIETGSQMKALIALLEKLDCSIIGLATIGIDINEVTQKWIDS